ncbi:Uncharacterised protein [Mycobacteroides abscessus subsp. abscessus]|nr:Uncharacterised protein [Mycobacteroides abscessus subsp. abscessus]SKS95282.1 Uncharacterised protein [Mycobacteroides abscessus subsp. abscessus]
MGELGLVLGEANEAVTSLSLESQPEANGQVTCW